MEKKQKSKNNLLTMIILATLFGFIAGATGEIVIRTYLLNDFNPSYYNTEFNINDLNSNRSNLIIRDAKKVVVNQDVKVAETMTSIQSTLLRVYEKGDSVDEASSQNEVDLKEATFYDLNRPDFIALSITSDGWVAASLNPDIATDFVLDDYVAIDNNRKIYEFDEVSNFEDLPGNLVFLHLAKATNMPVRSVTSRSDLTLGQSVVMVADFDSVYLTSVSAIEFPEGVLSGDSLNVRLSLAGDLSERFANSFVFNLAGDLVAIAGIDRELIPAFSYTHYWQSFFSDKIFNPPYLGLNYLDLSRVKVVGLERDKGALLKESENEPAVLAKSPAAMAGLQAGDIITWINNKELDYNNDLSSVLTNFKPEEEITVVYLRSGVEESVKIKLEAKK
ncbi:MAG: S1C family serine protease [Patescibacteria group bacterium]|nr:S1C family serine protease [Patescibacteria group bacterium]